MRSIGLHKIVTTDPRAGSTIAGRARPCPRRVPGVDRSPGSEEKAPTLSTEPILSPTPSAPATAGSCASCGAPLAADQRYCLECGERAPARSDFLQAGSPAATLGAPARPPVPPLGAAPPAEHGGRANPWLTVLAGIGVLLLAMGVGVLIGRAGSSSGNAAPAQVITVGSVAGGGVAGSTGSEEALTGDWPANTPRGYTVQLQTLPEGTTVAAVGQAKSAATAKGASAVGALSESDYRSFSGSGYVVYSGVYRTRPEAQKALASLKSKFPAAKVVEVAAGSGPKASGAGGGSSGGATNIKKPASPKVLENLSHAKGKSYVEKSNNLPNVVETG